MQTEYEATFANVDKDEIREKLRKIGAKLVRPEFLQKRFNFPLPEASPLDHGWIRVRDEGDKITMSIKSMMNNGSIEGQKEIDLEVDSFEKAEEFLNDLGIQKKAYQESKRELWKIDDVDVCIDEWPWLEPFVEIEGASEEGVKTISEKLDFDYAQAIFGAVDVQYEKKYNVSQQRINSETPRFVFGEECPFN